jgi:uncharacterized protein (TIGR02246 family)
MRQVFSILALAALAIHGTASSAQSAPEPSEDESAIKSAIEAYAEAFNQHDTKGLAAQWSPEAVYINHVTGEQVVGQAAIAEQFAGIFAAQPKLRIDVRSESIQFLSPNVAVEHGSATLLADQADPEQFDYSAVYVKRDGKWLLDRVTDKAPEEVASHYDQLKPLEWLIGNWTDDADDARITTECNWTKNRNFLTRSFAINVGDRVEMSGMQIIGWDAAAKQILSWTFDSDGGFSEAVWTNKKNDWYVHNKGVLADGSKATALNIIKPIDENSFTWQTTERTVGGELLPNVAEVKIVRE